MHILSINWRRAWRSVRRGPGTALLTIGLLAAGIGGATSLFSPLYSLVLAPLSFPRAERIARIGGNIPIFDGYRKDFVDRDRLATIFSAISAYAPPIVPMQLSLTQAEPSKQVVAAAVTPEFFETLGTTFERGGSFKGQPVNVPVVVLSDNVWRGEFQSQPDVVGSTIHLDSLPYLVVGILTKGFEYPPGSQIWVPLGTISYDQSSIQFIGRLRDGLSMNRAADALRSIGYNHGQGPTGRMSKDGPVLESLQTFLSGDKRPLLWILWIVSIVFLLMACAGSANLLLARGSRRLSEIAVKRALGAGRLRLIYELLTETLLLALTGGLLGVWLSGLGSQWLQKQLPNMQTDHAFVPAALALGIALCLLSGLLCGCGPAIYATRRDDLSAFLKGSDSRVWAARLRFFTPNEMVAAFQSALMLVLLIATGLLLKNLSGRLSMPLGLQPENVATFTVDLPELPELTSAREKLYKEHNINPYGGQVGKTLEDLYSELQPEQNVEDGRNALFYEEALRRLAEVPEVISIGIMGPVPFTSYALLNSLNAPAVYKSNPLDTSDPPVYVRCIQGNVSSDSFNLLGIHILAGRAFTESDVADELATQEAGTYCNLCSSSRGQKDAYSGVAIINEALAQRFWPNENAVGKQFFRAPFEARTVVGVVSDFHQTGYDLRIVPAAYFPSTGIWNAASFIVRLRPRTAMAQFELDANRVLVKLMPNISQVQIDDMDTLSRQSLSNLHLALVLLGCFSLLGIIVAGSGIYMATALMTAARTKEMGIRITLGAHARHVCLLVLWRSARLLLVAQPIGLFVGWILSRSLSHFLFQVNATNTDIYIASSGFLMLVVLAAGLVPAVRVATMDPVKTLRYE